MNDKVQVRLWAPGHRALFAGRVCLGVFLILLTALGFTSALPTKPLDQSPPSTIPNAGCPLMPTNPPISSDAAQNLDCSSETGNQTSPQLIGADPVPDLSLPKTVVSSVDSLIGAGGVIQTSPQNITLYNSAITIRLRADNNLRDETVPHDSRTSISSPSWGVAVQMSGQWVPLSPTSSRLTVLGTNVTGTFVTRETRVAYGNYTGRLFIVYKALSSGPLKWDLGFTPDVSGHYAFVYDWLNITGSNRLAPGLKQYSVGFDNENYTFSWADVPARLNVTSVVSPGRFSIRIDLGDLVSGLQVKVDPSIVSKSASADATAYTFQRKLFYDPKGSRYWVFYYDSSMVKYSNSTDGVNWFTPQIYQGCPCAGPIQDAQVSVYVSGENVLVSQGSYCNPTSMSTGVACLVSLTYRVGTISGSTISWPAKLKYAFVAEEICPAGPCAATVEMRYVNGILGADGYAEFSANLYIQTSWANSGICNGSWSTESDIFASYKGQTFFPDCENSTVSLRSTLLPSDSTGAVRLVYQSHVGTLVQLRSRLFYGAGSMKADLATESAYIDSSSKGSNYHSSPLYVSQQSSGQSQIALLGFPVEPIPTDGYLASAVLTLDVESTSGTNCCQMTMSGIGELWTSTGVTWNSFYSQPYPLICPCLDTGVFSAGNLVVDITTIVDTWYSSGTGLGLQDTGTNAWIVQLDGVGSTYVPQLQYNFNCCMTPYDIVDPNTQDGNGFSGVVDNNYGVHLLYQGNNGNVTYAYRPSATSPWVYNTSILANTSFYPTLTVDYSTNYLYAFAIQGTSIVMKAKAPLQKWADSAIIFPLINRKNPVDLGSNFASASNANATNLQLLWTEGPNTDGTYNVTSALIPIQTTWSPYGASTDPWDGNGLSPYGQYFTNLQEYVSPSSGMLTAVQTDMSVPGRGLSLSITRVYTEPQTFLNGAYGFESYPWAPLGNGWQLDFPWMSTGQNPSVIHLWNGQGYAIPNSFWTSNPSLVNEYGEHFQMTRNATAVYLFSSSGTTYVFDPSSPNRLLRIVDSTGQNLISFSYSSNLISSITDTVGRVFLFCYNGAFLRSINQTSGNGNCNSSVGSIRGVVYRQNSNGSLIAAWDPAGRKTSYAYSAVSNSQDAPWLISSFTYPTNWYTNYSYTPLSLGTDGTVYRTRLQLVQSPTAPIRQFNYAYTTGPGTQVTNSTVTSYNSTYTGGSWILIPVSYTSYNFSFAGMTEMVYNAAHMAMSGDKQVFDARGEVIKDTSIVSDGGNPPKLGSYTDYYQYDQWGNQIYSRKVINPTTGWYHDSFNSYYNNGLPPGFYSFMETFSRNQGTAPDNLWYTTGGSWTVNDGQYDGTYLNGGLTNTFAWTNSSTSDISVQARVYIAQQINSTAQAGIFVHYPGTGDEKWSLNLVNGTSSSIIEVADDTTGQAAIATCSLAKIVGSWYTFNLTSYGSSLTGWVQQDGHPACRPVSTSFPYSPELNAKGFGMSTGGFSSLFDNVTATTVSPLITTAGFSNSFYQNGAPDSTIHNALAGSAQLQNATHASVPVTMESYDSYASWGGMSQTRNLLSTGTNYQWLTGTSVFDMYGNPVTVTTPQGRQDFYTYSANYSSAYLTNQTQIFTTTSTQITTLYSYNFTTGNVLSVTDPNGNATSYQNDNLGRITRITYPKNLGYVSYTYNDQGNYVDVTNENGWHTRQIYDGLGRLSTVERFSNGIFYSNSTTTFNWMNEPLNQTDPVGNKSRQQYDSLGRTVANIEADGNVTAIAYNDLQSWVEPSDQYHQLTCQVYDRLGRLVSTVEEASSNCTGIVTNYYYDEVGNLVRTVNSKGQTTTYGYDNLNRLLVVTYQDGTRESYSYDFDGEMIGSVSRAGATTTYIFDSLGRVASVNYPSPMSSTNTYTYDKNSNLLSLSSLNATISYSYDARNRILTETYAVNNNIVSGGGGGGGCGPTNARETDGRPCARTIPATSQNGRASPSPSASPGAVAQNYFVGYAYQGENLESITYDSTLSALQANYTYDDLGRATAVSTGTSPYANLYYYQNDLVKSITYGNNLMANYTYDHVSRPLTMTLKTSSHNPKILLALTYSYNKTGTIASVTGQSTTNTGSVIAVNEQYAYDPLYRLTNASVTSGSTATKIWYEYDSLGNRIAQEIGNLSSSFSYNNVNELTSWTWSQTVFSYDKNGELSTRNQTSPQTLATYYSWNGQGQFFQYSTSGGTQAYYAYDGMNRRVESVEGSTTTFYAYLGTETLYELVPSTNTQNNYIYAANIRIAKWVPGGATSYYHEDALGNTRLETDSRGNVLFSDNYQPFGADNGNPTGSETYKFTGKPVSQTTGLYYEYQRWYDPSVGRFISQDPLAGHLSDPQSLNPYVYVQNTPTSATDPTGMADCGWNPLSWGGCAENAGGAIASAWNSQPAWAKYTEIGVGVTAAVILTAGIAAPELLVLVPPLLVGDIGTGAGAAGVCEEDPEACDPVPPPVGNDVNPAGPCECPTLPAGGEGSAATEGASPGLETAEGGQRYAAQSLGRPGLVQYGPGPSEPGWSSTYATPGDYSTSAGARAGLSLHGGNPATWVRDVVAPEGSPMQVSQVRALWGQPGGGIQYEVADSSVWIVGPWRPLINIPIATIEVV